MVVKVEGPKLLQAAMTELLTDPRVGYSVNGLGRVGVKLEVISGGPPYVDGSGPLARHVVECVQQLAGPRILVGSGDEWRVVVGVPVGLEAQVLRGVLRGLMRYGKHGEPWWRRLAS